VADPRQDRDQRTEKPTDRQIERALDKGNVARSQDVGQVSSLGLFLAWAMLFGGWFLGSAQVMVRRWLRTPRAVPALEELPRTLLQAALDAAWLIGPLLLAIMVGAIVGQYLQTKMRFAKDALRIDFSKINPFTGIRKVFQLDSLFNAAKALVKTVLYAVLIWLILLPEWGEVMNLALLTPPAIFQETALIIRRILLWAFAIGLVIAVADYAWVRWRWYRNLYMTKKEVKDEAKEREIPAEVKRKQKQKMFELARRRMMAAVPQADVVVTNPTHVAVALKYEQGKMDAPLVLAKGKGPIARKIKEIARKHGIPLVEDPPLARTLEKLCRVGAPIPESLYRAVAEVFAWIWSRRKGAYRAHPEVEAEAAGRSGVTP